MRPGPALTPNLTQNLTLYLVTDRPACQGRDLLDVVRAALAGGATLVQVREKWAEAREFVELARAVKALTAPLGVPLVVNDRADVALAADADGLHVGQSDLHALDARAIIGPDRILGLSVHTEEEALAARGLPVDYLGAGPLFPTGTKTDADPPVGPEGLARIVARAGVPVVAIGGIGVGNAHTAARSGAAGVAVVSALCSAHDPQAAARAILEAFRGA